MKKLTSEQVKALLNSPQQVVIVPHVNPDGDAVGSSLGLYHYLIQKGHKVSVIVPNDYPAFLKWIPGTENIIQFNTQRERAEEKLDAAELVFTLDFNALHRSGPMQEVLEENNAIKIMIDHHQQPEDYANYTYSDVAMCSTAEMVYHFIEQMDDLAMMNKTIGAALYTGIMTDTASFRFPKTTSTTHRVVAHLMDLGVHHSDIHSKVYDANRFERIKLLGVALNNLTVLADLNTAYITLSQSELDQFGHQKGDTEGLVNYGLSVKGIKFAAIFIENKEEGIIKISLRSKGDFDVNLLAREHFNGGGHKNAAGGKSTLPLNETIEKFEHLVRTLKTDLQ
ncbi:MAG: bifunctional oligoribonuclease/PAP phosphatase NrnA [Flavobacteriaceae bacterium]|nr:bifunctional oligoribonuclease/PAP phosphatase NrnA [Flavobacteriaceae bacterium]